MKGAAANLVGEVLLGTPVSLRPGRGPCMQGARVGNC